MMYPIVLLLHNFFVCLCHFIELLTVSFLGTKTLKKGGCKMFSKSINAIFEILSTCCLLSICADNSFHFCPVQTPSFHGVDPERGPASGGTKISLLGTHLDAGSNVSVAIRGAPCRLLRYYWGNLQISLGCLG